MYYKLCGKKYSLVMREREYLRPLKTNQLCGVLMWLCISVCGVIKCYTGFYAEL